MGDGEDVEEFGDRGGEVGEGVLEWGCCGGDFGESEAGEVGGEDSVFGCQEGDEIAVLVG